MYDPVCKRWHNPAILWSVDIDTSGHKIPILKLLRKLVMPMLLIIVR